MPGVTIKVSAQARERIQLLAGQTSCSLGTVVERALDCYERTLREQEYLEGWNRFRRDAPQEFQEYMRESHEIESGLTDLWCE